MTPSKSRCPPWLLVLVAAASCRRPAPPAEGPAPTVREIPAPAAGGGRGPNLAATADGKLLLTWIEPADHDVDALRFSLRPAGGAWSEPQAIASGPGWVVNEADFPALAALPDGSLFASWRTRGTGGGEACDVQVSASRDGGKTWSAPAVPHRDGTPTEHAFVSFVPWTGGGMGTVWLDGRETVARGGATGLRFASLDAAGAASGESLLDPRVCDCCQTAAARAGDAVLVAYRDRSEGEVRDISVVRFAGGRWSEPATVARDGWRIDGCPVNGPALAADAAGHAVVAWFAAPDDKRHVRAAFSPDAGASWGAPIEVDDGRPLGRVDVVLLDGGDALVSWLERSGEGAELRVRRLGPSGRRDASRIVATGGGARPLGIPRMERAGAEVVLAWTDAAEPGGLRTAIVETR